ncbi:MAG: adenylyltransferase/cytidyltransferase family protein [Chlamydia sp.]
MRYPFQSTTDFMQSKIMKSSLLKQTLDGLKSSHFGLKKPTIATINGSFDLLHAGHLYILYEASKTADILVVALNSDASIARYKSRSRPIIALEHRMEMIAALSFVDFVTWFEEDDPRALIALIVPDIHVNGKEYGEACIEAETVYNIGGKLHLVDRIAGLATSDIIHKIRSLPS